MGKHRQNSLGAVFKFAALTTLFFASLFAWTTVAHAGWTEPPTNLSATSGSGAEQPQAAVDNAGNAATVWLGGSGLTDIMFNQIAGGGEPEAGTETELTGTDPGMTPDVALSTEGDGLAVWIDGDGDVMGSSFEAGGDPSAAFEVASLDDWTASAPQVAVAPDGDAFVAFTYTTGDPVTESYVSGVYVPAGDSPGPILDLSTALVLSSGASIDVDGAGEFHLAWSEGIDPDGVVRGTIVSDEGIPGTAFDISDDSGSAAAATIATNESGEAIVVFGQSGGNNVARIDPTGTVTATQPLNTGGIAAPASIGIADDGFAVATGLVIGGPDGIGVYASKIPADGAPAAPELVSVEGGFPAAWNVGVDARGNTVISMYATTEAAGAFVQTANYMPAGGEFTGVTVLDPFDSATSYGFDMSRSGQAIVAWNGFGDGEPGSYDGMMASRFAAVADVAPSSLDFGALDVGQSATKQVTIENSGGSPLDVSAIEATGAAAGDYSVTAAACTDDPIAIGASCSVDVKFTPSAAGARAVELNVNSDSTAEVSPVALSGSGNASPPPPDPPPNPPVKTAKVKIAKVSPKSSKVKRGKRKTIKVRVTNSGDAAATSVKVCPKLNGSAKKKIKAGGCASLGQIAAGASKTASVKVTVKKGKKVKGKAKFNVKLTSGNGGGGSAQIVVNIPK